MGQRVVAAARGVDAAMGYRYRARIETRQRVTWLGFGEQVTEHRYVIERYFMAWYDQQAGCWSRDRSQVEASADRCLDRIESRPNGEYLQAPTTPEE